MKRALLLLLLPLFVVGCAPREPVILHYIIPKEEELPGRTVQSDRSVIVPYSSFVSAAEAVPSRVAALKLFNKLLAPQNSDDYVVKVQEFNISVKKIGDASSNYYQFTLADASRIFSEPSLIIHYIIDNDDVVMPQVNNQILALAGFQDRCNLEMFRNENEDAIAAFYTRDHGPELEVVARAVGGPNNVTAVITLCDPQHCPKMMRRHMVKALKSLQSKEIFPGELVNPSLDQELRDLEICLETSISNRDDEPACKDCAHILEMAPFALHGAITTNKAEGRLVLDIYRPYFEKTEFTSEYDIAMDAGTPFCLDSRRFLPGERVELIVKDLNGTPIKKFPLHPNPLSVKSDVDGAVIYAELAIDHFYVLKGEGINGKVIFESRSGEESKRSVYEKFQDMCIMYSPAAIGKRSGVGYVTFTRESGEKLELSIPWGPALINKGSV